MDLTLAAKHVEASLSGNDEAADAVEVNGPVLRALFVVGEDAYDIELTVTKATHVRPDE